MRSETNSSISVLMFATSSSKQAKGSDYQF